MKEVTPRMQEFLDHIRRLYAETGKPPTHAALARLMGITAENARQRRCHLMRDVRRGEFENFPGLFPASWASYASVPWPSRAKIDAQPL